jgi:hypothetical protein
VARVTIGRVLSYLVDSIVARFFVDEQVFVSKTLDWAGAITGSTIWDPTTGTRFNITDIEIGCSAASTVTIFDETDDTTNRVCKFDLSQYGGVVITYRKVRRSAAVDNILKATCSAAGGYITVSGYESS